MARKEAFSDPFGLHGIILCDVSLASARVALARCRVAADCVRAGRFGEAREILRGVAAVWPRARWIDRPYEVSKASTRRWAWCAVAPSDYWLKHRPY